MDDRACGSTAVSPAIDRTTQTLYFVYKDYKRLFQHSFLSRAALKVFDIQAVRKLPATFVLNAHLASSLAAPTFTLLLSGSVASTPRSNGQYALAFTPNDTPSSLLCARRISTRAHCYTAAWNLALARKPRVYCPIVVRTSSASRDVRFRALASSP